MFVKNNGGGSTLCSCPCKRCINCSGLVPLGEISLHFLKHGIESSYTFWRFHGERSVVKAHRVNTSAECVDVNVEDAAENFEHVVDPSVNPTTTYGANENVGAGIGVNAGDGVDENAGTSRVDENAGTSRYNGATAVLELMKEFLLEGKSLPCKFPEVKKMIQELEPRYIKVFNDERKLTQVAQKTLRHFPIIERLRRFYSVPWIAEAILWHCKTQSGMNVMRHPVDSAAWQCADKFSLEFSKETRNVTLRIATDGFNPNGCFGLNYSCWPVILHPYNFAHSYCMLREFSMLALLISGPRAPGKDIDVYLQSLIDVLKQLWNVGAITYDAFTKTEFMMKARLLWSIRDFPALGTLSGCVTHGYYAFPTCGEYTVTEWPPFSKKICYMGRSATPWPLTGQRVEEMVHNMKCRQGKRKQPTKKCKIGSEYGTDEEEEVSKHCLFSRRSILYDLPNWSSNSIRHCTDVMHTEKNITEHIINTIMGNNKSKDGPNARTDLEAIRIKRKVWMQTDELTGKT
ncbi:uncharacterized protein LOC113333648 [Papaver somniferum]|uniref:uncharacterized protein LOC113333648 n=1 Tax=Papaver somniferum TaxID=3469 RepID=UPI000E701ACB|nr:uncharacterized protein LOC113333648 [Papaver somniferum]